MISPSRHLSVHSTATAVTQSLKTNPSRIRAEIFNPVPQRMRSRHRPTPHAGPLLFFQIAHQTKKRLLAALVLSEVP
jgi:hypothetical protein